MTVESIVFYTGSGSPYGWRVWLALEHKGLPYTLNMLSFSAGETHAAPFLAVNPRGKVPAIVHEGLTLWESNAILEYLEDRFPEPHLWPADVQARAHARRLVAENDAYLYPVLRRVIAETLYKAPNAVDHDALAKAREELRAELARFAGELPRDFFGGDAPDGADFTLFPSLAFLDRIQARAPHFGITADLPAPLRAYLDRMTALPIVQKTWPPHWRG
jgi:glutathione S-transferase